MTAHLPPRRAALVGIGLALAACGGTTSDTPPPYDPYSGPPPMGTALAPGDGTAILDGAGDPSGWTWFQVEGSLCNDANLAAGSYVFSTSQTGIAVSWGAEGSTDLVIFLQGGGACWDFATCGGLVSLGIPTTAATGPFGAEEFRAEVYLAYPNAWLDRANLPAALADANLVFVPYCTGDIHGGDRVTTYAPPPGFTALPSVTWNHAGHANLMAFLERLGPTFPVVSRLVVAGSSAGGFGALASYPAFRWYWPDAAGYLVDDSGPPLVGGAIPSATRAAWYSSWDLGVSLDAFCTGCRVDMSTGLAELSARYPEDRLALLSTLQDAVIRAFFGTFSLSPPSFTSKSAEDFEAELRALGTGVLDPATGNAKFFFTTSPAADDHPLLDDPTVVTTPAPGLGPWLEAMLTDDPAWASVADPTPAP